MRCHEDNLSCDLWRKMQGINTLWEAVSLSVWPSEDIETTQSQVTAQSCFCSRERALMSCESMSPISATLLWRKPLGLIECTVNLLRLPS